MSSPPEGTTNRDEAALKGAPSPPPPPPGPPLHGSDEAAAAASGRARAPDEPLAAGTPAVGGEGGVGGAWAQHEGRVPGRPAALKTSHFDELVHPKAAQDSAAVRGRDAKKQGHAKHER